MDLTIKDVAKLFNISEAAIHKLLLHNKIPSYCINGEHRFGLVEIENWMLKFDLKQLQETASCDQQIYPLTNQKQQMQIESPVSGGMVQFCLYRALHQGDVLVNIKGNKKEEIISSVTKIVAPKLNVDAEVLAELLIDREDLSPTALGNGLAVPHTREAMAKGSFDMVFIVYPEAPLEYGALDSKLVHTLFFLFAGSDKAHLQLLAKLAHLSSHKEAFQLLLDRSDKATLLDFVRNWEGQIRSIG
ncbi:PTS sugar transporter subunit IIA [Candidatus Rhabdochlamydia porcellionis]|jgi:nitrogen PTS system EIIA component|uniref:Phosphoenolpyruvate-dependent sugar phosphotransferase system n=1 Tax=Candidatus Rhabdochlamydia porcellionis TaxID=225148 RepID=A0ABX8Z260_9BACT|nr:PTS sugar transporter subunit IIA [Candidatus Rhabdochlamydia porcellionis]QZA58413.1 Phosphoenolpyruvate-dependent sugar phosphotransferase system [Candidatus Rhabdochlamydia porcellionis]